MHLMRGPVSDSPPVRDDLMSNGWQDDWQNLESEFSDGIYCVTLLGMALGGMGSAARDSHHGHCEACLPT